jgi:hemerythrin-like domain-containing protein
VDPNRPPPSGHRDSEPCAPKHGIMRQHEKLAALCSSLLHSLAVEGEGDCVAIASQLQLALDSHFTVEENVLFPGLRSEHPELEAQITFLEVEHASFRQQLDQLLFCIGATSHAQAGVVLSDLREQLDDHETREESFLGTDPESRGS